MNYSGKYLTIIFLLIGFLFLYQPLEGQIVFGQPPSGEIKFIYQSWTITETSDAETTLNQWVLPVYGFVPVRDNVEIIFTSSTAGASRDVGDDDISLTGLNDSRVAVYASFFEDRVLLGAGINLPTGKKSLDSDEIGVVNWLTESFLNFPIKNYGEGFGATIEAGYARTFDAFSFGGGASYLLKTAYEPLEGIEDYKPGNMLRLAAFGTAQRDQFWGRLSLVYSIYGEDKLDGTSLFKDGDIFDLTAEFRFSQDRISALLGLREIVRGKDKRIISGELNTEPEKSHGAETRIYGETVYRVTERIGLKGLLDYQYVAANGYADDHPRSFGSSNYFGFGAGVTGSFYEMFRGVAEFEYFTGSADDDILDLSGWQFIIGVGASF
ncbi:MAG: hypothetical protein GWO41_17090 [candidate division Zixibacteria bacterium]|nr:hypothetical protein [candidate division Zixibacteria bacterium]NIR65012.1 hypothetical protein [candidate division Zixibacteria bacterium]NIS18134.1 hypothetical protein [candidate division Zixibacteria bacterium]NIS46797.1 hypothetical protein [candidate division Zixibacteria bacterium]NIT54408.1 hypothetical protein [candidate division Zixibacteria bacterium]